MDVTPAFLKIYALPVKENFNQIKDNPYNNSVSVWKGSLKRILILVNVNNLYFFLKIINYIFKIIRAIILHCQIYNN